MPAAKEKTIVKMRLNAECPSHARTDVSVRDQNVTLDEPVERGGTNQGLTPTETLMASLLACTNVITHRVAAQHGVKISGMKVRLEADFDRRGVQLSEEIDVPFPSVTLFIDIATSSEPAALEAVKRDLGRFCPVSKVLRQSGTEVKEVWNINRT